MAGFVNQLQFLDHSLCKWSSSQHGSPTAHTSPYRYFVLSSISLISAAQRVNAAVQVGLQSHNLRDKLGH